jgi:hypothetical protein
MSTLLNSLEVAAKAKNGTTGRYFQQKISSKRGTETASISVAAAGVNQPVLNLSWVLPTSQLDACEALWVNQSRLDFTASNNTFG